MNIFNSVKQSRIKKSLFDLTHDVKLSCNQGELIPVLCADTVPGDKFQLSGEALVRFAPILAPVMHRYDVTIHYFFVPYRILWDNWETFITGAALNPSAPGGVPAFPTIEWISASADPGVLRLGNFLGVPLIPSGSPVGSAPISAMPFAAYWRIWWDYYRDQNLQLPNGVAWVLDDGDNPVTSDEHGSIFNRAWEHDYFTAALPWAQKGPNVQVPMAQATTGGTLITKVASGDPDLSGILHTDASGGLVDSAAANAPIVVNAGTINDLRKAYKLQEWLENNARSGTRYKESMIGHYGVNSSDARLQRPEYITGMKTQIVISEVLQTVPDSTSDTPLANMGGHGVAVNSGQAGTYFCEEHGIIMGIMSIMPKTAYQQGLPKQFLKFDFLDFGWPEFAHLGEQAIDFDEIYAFQGFRGDPFGYIPRYAEYKFMLNRVCGDFQTTLNYWHSGRIFDSNPNLNDDFVVSDPTRRIFAVTDESVDTMYCQVLHHIKALRPFPKYGNPGW